MTKIAPPLPTKELPRSGAGWSFYAAFGTSTLLHLLLLVVGAWVMFEMAEPPIRAAIDGQLAERKIPKLQPELLTKQTPEITLRDPDVRASASSHRRAAAPLRATPVERPLQRASLLPENALGNSRSTDLAEKVGAIDPSAGAGTGDGGGSSGGVGFFKVKSEAKTVVFVVDCSTSMRKPHPSKWKTRFRRLQAELVAAISRMKPDQSFFIIFFNDEAIPMPARTLQPATLSVKRHYLRWMSRQRANGRTDPRGAMTLALRLRPDAIYFLTDGVFGFGIRKQLLALKQDRVAIHTFAFGNVKAEDSMKAIAKANGGKYVFVP